MVQDRARAGGIMTFEESLEWGEEGEHLVAQWLLSKGATVVPLFQFENHDKAPVALCGKRTITLPDLAVYKMDEHYFVEVKRKRRWVRHLGPKPPWIETGLNAKLLLQYLEWSKQHSRDVWLVFVHEDEEPCGWFAGKLSELVDGARFWNGRGMDGRYVTQPEIFFRFDKLKPFGPAVAKVCPVQGELPLARAEE